MSIIQNNVNKLFEEKEKQDRLASSIIEQKNNQINEIIKQHQDIQTDALKNQEVAYENSIYYQNYQMFLNMLQHNIIAIYYETIQNYQNNNMIFKNPYYEEIKIQKIISGIGYPIPEKYQNQIKQIIKNRLNEISAIEDGKFEVEIMPTQYIKQSNLIKKMDSYTLEVTLNKKIEKNKLK